MKQDRAVDVAGSLRLVSVVLHDVGEVDVLADNLWKLNTSVNK